MNQQERRGGFSLVGSLENFRLVCRTALYNSYNSHSFGNFQSEGVNKTSLMSTLTQLVRERLEIERYKRGTRTLVFSGVFRNFRFVSVAEAWKEVLSGSLTDNVELIIEQALLERLKALDHFRPILPSFAQFSHFFLDFSESSQAVPTVIFLKSLGVKTAAKHSRDRSFWVCNRFSRNFLFSQCRF